MMQNQQPPSQREERYKGFIITWWEPQQTGSWTVTIEPGDLSSFDTFAQTMGFDGSTLQQALSNAKSFIDGLR